MGKILAYILKILTIVPMFLSSKEKDEFKTKAMELE